PHPPQLSEPFLDSALHHILQMNDAENRSIFGDHEWSSALLRYFIDSVADGGQELSSALDYKVAHRVRSALANAASHSAVCGFADRQVNATHSALRGKRNKHGVRL